MSTLTPNPLAEQIRAMVAQERAAARHQPIPDAPTTPEREVVRQMVTQARMNRHQWAGGITPESLGAPPTAGEAGDYATPAAVLTPQAPQDPVAAVRARLARMDAGLPGQPPPADPRAGWIDEGAPAMQSIPDPGFVGNLIEGAKQGFAAATPAGLRSDPYGPGPLPAQGVGGFLGTVAGSLNPLGMLKPENAPFIAVGAMAGGAIARALRPITGKIASKLGGRAAAAFDDAIAEAPEEAAQAMAEQASKENWDRDPWGALQRTLAAGALGGTAGGLAGGALGGAFKTKPEHRPTRAEVLEAERAAPYTVRPEVEQERRAGFEAYEDALQRGRMQGARQDQPTIAATPGRPYGDVASTAARALREAGARGEPARQAAARTARDLRDTPGITDEQVAQYAARMLLEASTPELTPGEPTDAQGPEGTQAPTGTPPPAAEAGDSGSPAPDAGMRARTPQTPQPGQPAPGQPTRADLTWETRQYLYDLRYTDDDIAAMQPDEPAFLVEHRIGREEWTPKEPTDAVQEAVRPPVPAEAAPQQRPAPLEAPGQGRAVPEGQRLRQPADQQPDDVGPAAVGDRAGRGTENPPDGNRQAVRDRTPAAGALNETPPPQRGPEPTADRPGPAAGTADAARQGPADARRPQPRTPTPARKPKRGEWSRADIDRRIVTAAERLGIDAVESARDTDELSTEREVSLATRAPQLPTEIREALEGKPHLKRYFQTNMRNGTLEDSMADLGVDRLIQHAEELAGNDSAKARDHLRKMAGYDPEAAFLTWLRDVQPGNARLREKWQVVDNPAQALDEGDTLRINGREFEVVTDGDYKMLTERGEDGDGLTVHLEALDALPVDADSIGRPADPDQETEPPSREPDKAGQSRTKPDNPDPIVTPTDERARVAGEIRAAFGQEGEAFLPIMDAFVAGLPKEQRGRYWAGLHVQKGGEPGSGAVYMTAWHGSPHVFDKFSTDKIGTGEGAQAYGYGLYFSSKRWIGEHYRNALARNLLEYEGRPVADDKAFEDLVNKELESQGLPTTGRRQSLGAAFVDNYRWYGRTGAAGTVLDDVIDRTMRASDHISGPTHDKVRDALRHIAEGLEQPRTADRPTYVPRPKEGPRAQLNNTEQNALFELESRLHWINPEKLTPEQAMARVRSDLELTVEVQTEREAGLSDARPLSDQEHGHALDLARQLITQHGRGLSPTYADGDPARGLEAVTEWFAKRATDASPGTWTQRDWTDNLAEMLVPDEDRGNGTIPEISKAVYEDPRSSELWDLGYKSRLLYELRSVQHNRQRAQEVLALIDKHQVGARIAKPAGRLYEVDLAPTDEELLDWDRPLHDQPPKVKAAMTELGYDGKDDQAGSTWYKHLSRTARSISDGPPNPKKASAALKALGIRGIKYQGDTSGATNYVIFDDADVAIKTFHQDQANAPVFYSKLRRTVEEKMGGSMDAAQLRKMLENNGVKPEELEWSRLAALSGKVTKQQALDHLDEHAVRVEEVTKGGEPTTDDIYQKFKKDAMDFGVTAETAQQAWGFFRNGDRSTYNLGAFWNEWDERFGDHATTLRHLINRADVDVQGRKTPTKFESYQVPGGSDYRELLLTLPSNERPWILRKKALAAGIDDIAEAERRFGNAATFESRPDFTQSHWSEPNVLAHVRFNTRTINGKKVLFLEEIQSDWHQKGRDKGYQQTVSEADRKRFYDGKGDMPDAEWEALAERVRGADSSRVPDAPFKKNWHELAMKRMIRYAAEHGYDQVAWTHGDIQNERYDLSKQVDSIDVGLEADGQTYWINANKGGRSVVSKDGLKPQELADHIGKDLAHRAITDLEEKTFDEKATADYKQVADAAREFIRQEEIAHGQPAFYIAEDRTSTAEPFVVRRTDTGAQVSRYATEPEAAHSLANFTYGFRRSAGEITPAMRDAYTAYEAVYNRLWSHREDAGEFPPGSKERTKAERSTRYSGLDLKVGGEGMRGFYDKILVNDTNKLIKKHGGRVGIVEIPTDQGDAKRIHLIDGGRFEFQIQPAEAPRSEWTTVSIHDTHAQAEAAMARHESGKTTETTHGFDITPELRAEALKGQPLFQGPHASFEITAAGRRIIRALTDPNAASLPHEVAHDWLEMLPILDPPMAQKAYAALGVKPGEKPTTGQHEQFARGFEAYQREGKAPTKALESTFAKFKQWLRNLYRAIRGTPLEGKLTPELRAFFTELLGRSEQAAAIRAATPNVASATPNVAEPAAGGTLDKTTGEQPQTGAEQPPPGPDPWMTSARQTMTDDDRASMGLDELDSPERRGWQQAIDTARQRGLNTAEKAMRLAAEVNANPRALSDIETAGLVEHATKLKNEHRAALKAVAATDEPADVSALAEEATRIEEEFDALTRALRASGTEKGRALASQKLTLDQDYDLISVKARAKAKKGAPLTEGESAKLAQVTKQLEEATAKLQALERAEYEREAAREVRLHKSRRRGVARDATTREFDYLLYKAKRLLAAGC